MVFDLATIQLYQHASSLFRRLILCLHSEQKKQCCVYCVANALFSRRDSHYCTILILDLVLGDVFRLSQTLTRFLFFVHI